MSYESKRRKYSHNESTNLTEGDGKNIKLITSTQTWESMPSSDTNETDTCKVTLWWQPATGEDEQSVMCNIMQDQVHLIDLEGLPSFWPTETLESANENTSDVLKYANAAKLTCGHVFHPTALALHFVNMDMRCPVCREGSHKKLNLQSLPASVQSMFCSKKQQLQKDNALDQIDIASIIAGLELQIQIRGPAPTAHATHTTHATNATNATNATHTTHTTHTTPATPATPATSNHMRSILNTRIMSTDTQLREIAAQQANASQDTSITQANLINFPIHRSFQRILRSVLMRHADSSGCVFTIMLHHPLVPLHISSVEMSGNQFMSSMFNCLTMSGTPMECSGEVPLFCPVVGGSDRVAVLNSVYTSESTTASMSVDINMYMILNVAQYVSEVLGSLAQAASQSSGIGPHMLVSELVSLIH